MKKQDDKLAKIDMTSQELGEALLQAAKQKEQALTIASATEEVRQLMQVIEAYNGKIREYRIALSVNEKRLKAIEHGEFTLSKDRKIVYNDEELETSPKGFRL